MGDVLAVGVTHYPKLVGIDENMADTLRWTLQDPDIDDFHKQPANWPKRMAQEWADPVGAAREHRAALRKGFQRVRQALDAFRPDAIVIWGDDQYENFREDIIPPWCVYAHESFDFAPWEPRERRPGGPPRGTGGKPNVWNEGPDVRLALDGHPEIGKFIASYLLANDFDVAYSYQPLHWPGLSHAFGNAVLLLDYERRGFPFRIVPMAINCYGRRIIAHKGGNLRRADEPSSEKAFDPPSPSPTRCFRLGQSLARGLVESPWRIALMASSSWSHAFLVDKYEHLYPDVDADRALFGALARGRYELWENYSLAAIEDAGQQEMLNWFPLVGAVAELGLKSRHCELVESYIFNSNKCFAVFDGAA